MRAQDLMRINEEAQGFNKAEQKMITDLMLDGGLNSLNYDPEREVNVCPIIWSGKPLYMRVYTFYKTPKWDDGDGHSALKWVHAKLEMADREATFELWRELGKKSLLNLFNK